jgi:hypothetical protein
VKNIFGLFAKWRSHPRALLLLPATLLAICLVPAKAQADVTEIILFLTQIESTLQSGIGQVLSNIQSAETALNTLHQELVWPLAEINQARAFVNATINQYKSLMNEIHSIEVESATLVNPSHLEIAFRGSATTGLSTIQPAYTQVYNAVPPATNASPLDRNMMDMDDASAVAALKSSSISDQNSNELLDVADVIEQQAGDSAPGSAPIIAAQAQIANLENQAQMAKLLATELRLEAAHLAHENALLKRSAQHRTNLQQQMQQVGVTP